MTLFGGVEAHHSSKHALQRIFPQICYERLRGVIELNNTKQIENIMSVGIDIGTSTTKLVISQFAIMDVAGFGRIPKIEIVDKQVLYESPIYRTPLVTEAMIDMKRVVHIVEEEYEKAGIQKEDIQTGAVIITGETAIKRNAEEVVHHLAHSSGEFLVATAGPDLEAIIAAKGSGALDYSKDRQQTVANIDIGGGTANIAVYSNGRLCGTCTLHIGGRLIEWQNGCLAVSPSITEWLNKQRVKIEMNTLSKITLEMAAVLARFLEGAFTEEDQLLLHGKIPSWTEKIDVLVFSGGIADCMYYHQTRNIDYQDIGIILADSLLANELLARWEWMKPKETVRATVLGAGMQITEISGSTIEVDNRLLPLRNLPICTLHFNGDFQFGLLKLPAMIEESYHFYDANQEGKILAFYITGLPYMSFLQIRQLALRLNSEVGKHVLKEDPLVIVLDSDYGKVLGQSIKVLSDGRSVICIDQIQVDQGDYIDIGRILRSEVVPVVVKTLVFQNAERGKRV